jgi:ureidoglycolate dehydrogenase (NAD+)
MKYFNAQRVLPLMEEQLAFRGVDPDSVKHVVASLIQTSLRGVDSHGINLFPHYCRAVEAGRVNARPSVTSTRTGSSVSRVDADHAFGHYAGVVAMREAIELSRESGIGAVSVKNSTHFGAAAYFGLMAPEQDCLGFVFTNGDALVKAFGAKEAFFGTNPICFTAPLQNEAPFCLDMATSQVSWNKINNYRRENSKIPFHWAFDAEGMSVTDPHAARSLNPIGEYKGFGLGMMVDILCATLAGGLISKDVMAMFAPPIDNSKRCISHFLIAIDISRFCEATLFRQNLQGMVNRVRSLPPMNYGENIMVAGDPEKKSFIKRSKDGIPIDSVKYSEYMALNPDFSQALEL